MTYVDSMMAPYRGMLMCHMVADTLEELHAMADAIGVRRKWFQNKSVPHYDICKTKRKHAVALGAKEVDRRELGSILKRIKYGNQPTTPNAHVRKTGTE